MNLTKAYLSIITQTWNRFDFDDLVRATALVTNNFKDPWVSAKGPGTPTGKLVLAKMNDSAFKTYGGAYMQSGTMTDNDTSSNISDPNHYNGGVSWDIKSIQNYWAYKAKSGDSFSESMYYKIYSHSNDDRPAPVLAVEVGQLAYGIWKACNSRVLKQQANKQSLTDQNINFDTDYPFGKKLQNLVLKLTGFRNVSKPSYRPVYGRGYVGWGDTTDHLIYGLDEKTGIKFKIKCGTKDQVGGMLKKLFDKTEYGETNTFDLNSTQPIYITVTGKVKNTSTEYKTVSLNYAVITSPTPEEVTVLGEKLKAEKIAKAEEEKAKKDALHNEIMNNINSSGTLYRNLPEEKQEEFENTWNAQIEKIKNGLMTNNEQITYTHESEILNLQFGVLKNIVVSLKNKPEEFKKWKNNLEESHDYDILMLVITISKALDNGYYKE